MQSLRILTRSFAFCLPPLSEPSRQPCTWHHGQAMRQKAVRGRWPGTFPTPAGSFRPPSPRRSVGSACLTSNRSRARIFFGACFAIGSVTARKSSERKPMPDALLHFPESTRSWNCSRRHSGKFSARSKQMCRNRRVLLGAFPISSTFSPNMLMVWTASTPQAAASSFPPMGSLPALTTNLPRHLEGVL